MKSYLHPLFCFLAMLATLTSVQAQTASTGSVSGRIFNPVTEEYVRNAQVRIAQTNQVAVSESGGYYRITNLRPGEVTVEVSYIGMPTIRAIAQIVAGEATTLDFTLLSTESASAENKEEVIQLEKFVVSTEREGQAKAIMDQRMSMNITHTIASDVFGDDPEGNVGEFLRNVPGVFLGTTLGEVRNVGLGGLAPEYTSITVDGMSLGAADASDSGANTRAPSFEMVSLSSMDSLEISRTISADVDADAPAGTINMRTKNAFDRKGTHFAVRMNMSMHSSDPTFHKTFGPDDDAGVMKTRPGGIIEFSTTIANKLGIVINISESNIYSEADRITINYDRSPTAADPRLQVPTSLVFTQSPRTNRRFAATVRTDWAATKRLTLSLATIYNYSKLWNMQRGVTFTTGGRASVVGENPEYSFRTTGASYVTVNPMGISKMGETLTLTPRFEYKLNNLTIEGAYSYSDSLSWYESLDRHGTIYSTNSPRTTNTQYSVERSSSSDVSTDYKITQTSGPSFSDGASFSMPRFILKDDRSSGAKFSTGQLDVSSMTRFLIPITWKAGYKTRTEKRTFDDDRRMHYVKYTGSATNWADYASPYEYSLGSTGVDITSITGGSLFLPNLSAIGRLYQDNPSAFVADWNATNYYETNVVYKRNFKERMDAAYLMATSMLWNNKITLRAGMRWEGTTTKVLEPNPYTVGEVIAAGYAVSGDGIATTTEGIDYQFLSRPKVTRKGEYDNFFPSASLKYTILPNLEFHVGFSTTIRRPTYGDVAGVWIINENSKRISAPNMNLRPENAKNFAARLAYYFKGVGELSAAVYQNDLKDAFQSTEVEIDEFGYALGQYVGDIYSGYTFISRYNGPDKIRVRSLELSYSQNLGFLGRPFKRLTARLNYTRAYATETKSDLIPHSVNAGLNYTYRRLNAYANCNWTDDYPITATGQSYRRHRTQVDIGGGWKFTKNYSFMFSVRNLTNTDYIHMQHVKPSNPTLYMNLETGAVISVSVKGQW